jgi:ribosomal protein S12 methylthiotransferase accessory factor
LSSFGAHPSFEVALERCLTELLQGRSFEGLNDVPPPTFNSYALTEPGNFVEHFIDSTGVISWKFFSVKQDYEFCNWDFSGTTEEENECLMNILKGLEKEVYVATYENFGATACRILVPSYSEVYPAEDLIWDNTNKALMFRKDILNIHTLTGDELEDLLERFEEQQLDHYTKISELIGIGFDENTVWGKLDIGELKILIYLVLEHYEEAKEIIADFLNFNDNTVERVLFYQALGVVLDITIADELDIDDYVLNLNKMYGAEVMENALGSVIGDVKFFGLTKTSLKLEGLDKHLKLIDSYKKLYKARELQQ